MWEEILFFKIEFESWQRQSPSSSGEAGHEGKAGHRRWLTNVPSLDSSGRLKQGSASCEADERAGADHSTHSPWRHFGT